MLCANPDTAAINRPASLNAADERIKGPLMSKLRDFIATAPAKLCDSLQVLGKVFTIDKVQLAQALEN